jgi:Protein of unknown function (DUF4085)
VIFFTRDLYRGVQPKSGWERRAENEWYRRVETYARYSDVILPMLPSSVRRLCKQSLHDGVVSRVVRNEQELILIIDATNALGGFRGRQVCLTFRGVKGKPRVSSLIGQWWLYEEAHLSSLARFNVQVLFDTDEIEIVADELQIAVSKFGRGA